MKRIHFAAIALFGIACLGFIKPDSDINMPDWEWRPGEVEFRTLAEHQAFNIQLDPPRFNAGDKLKITISSIKVSLTGLSRTTTFARWKGKVNFVYQVKSKWLPLVADTNDRINKPFTNIKSNPTDSLVDYSFIYQLPKDGRLHVTVRPLDFELDTASGHGHPIFAKGYGTVTVEMKGIKIEKR